MVGDEIGAGEADVAVGGVDAVDVHIANGEGQAHRVIATHAHRGVIASFVAAADAISARSVPVPEVNKRLGEKRRRPIP